MTRHARNWIGVELVSDPSTVLSRRRARHAVGYLSVKRGVDIAAAAVLLAVAMPLLAILALLIRLDGGPVVYRQKRLGRDGQTFMLWKLRSMVPDAETRLEHCLACDPAARAEWQSTQKLRHDPRVTWIGRILRKYSLDELPQLWNVLVGDMSLIGPRPMMLDQRTLYPGPLYWGLRPGLTGLWQVSDRNACSFEQRAAFDARYAASLSPATDLGIVLRTVWVVAAGTGC